jgi:hypothetical protein
MHPNKFSVIRRFHLFCFAAFLTIAGARAAVVVSNLGEPTLENGWNVALHQFVGMSFTVGTAAPSWNLESLELRLWVSGTRGDFTAELHADSGGLPGS